MLSDKHEWLMSTSDYAQDVTLVKRMDLSNSPLIIDNPGFAKLARFPSLNYLNLTNCEIRNMDVVCDIHPLKTLILTANHISHLPSRSRLIGLDNLEILDLRDNQLTSPEEVNKLTVLASLREVNLSGNPIPNSSWDAIRAVLPASDWGLRTLISEIEAETHQDDLLESLTSRMHAFEQSTDRLLVEANEDRLVRSPPKPAELESLSVFHHSEQGEIKDSKTHRELERTKLSLAKNAAISEAAMENLRHARLGYVELLGRIEGDVNQLKQLRRLAQLLLSRERALDSKASEERPGWLDQITAEINELESSLMKGHAGVGGPVAELKRYTELCARFAARYETHAGFVQELRARRNRLEARINNSPLSSPSPHPDPTDADVALDAYLANVSSVRSPKSAPIRSLARRVKEQHSLKVKLSRQVVPSESRGALDALLKDRELLQGELLSRASLEFNSKKISVATQTNVTRVPRLRIDTSPVKLPVKVVKSPVLAVYPPAARASPIVPGIRSVRRAPVRLETMFDDYSEYRPLSLQPRPKWRPPSPSEGKSIFRYPRMSPSRSINT